MLPFHHPITWKIWQMTEVINETLIRYDEENSEKINKRFCIETIVQETHLVYFSVFCKCAVANIVTLTDDTNLIFLHIWSRIGI